ncbi:hypothetical protein PPTG_17276 [Phytophthora nicotianae INRA-310]|uniref:SET domain-containing protein n=1 Tax=Phytophthora nicotianae (strain INRA-310) TaxID=761204 RepID=W2PLP7_PHYN3|nr:hypothetical protein PPTG_17276 [Phytophthora nicotianae INRA-310]ETN00950.1 hypothetical protein PPTG_17276 [Phytophthora nicotianae INRA-310]
MVGLSATQLPPETLRPGDILEYFSQGFVCGDRRGLRVGVVLQISSALGNPFPVSLDTEEPLPLTNMVRRRFDIAGTALLLDSVRWRKLRSFQLVPGVYKAPKGAARLCDALKAHLDEAFASIGAVLPSESDETSSRPPNRFVRDPPRDDPAPRHSRPSRTPIFGIEPSPCSSETTGALTANILPEGFRKTTLQMPVEAIVDLAGDDMEQDVDGDGKEDEKSTQTNIVDALASPPWSRNKLRRMPSNYEPITDLEAADDEPEVSDTDVLAAGDFMETVPTRWERHKRRHQRKQKAGQWREGRSRKRRHLKLCGVTRSDMRLYNAYSTKARSAKAILRIRGLRTRLRELRLRRSTYVEPSTTGYFLPKEVPWPSDVLKTNECLNTEGVEFADVGDFGRCSCAGDCYLDTCANADGALYCTPESCNLAGKCSNAPRTLDTLKLFDTGRVGLGVYTTNQPERRRRNRGVHGGAERVRPHRRRCTGPKNEKQHGVHDVAQHEVQEKECGSTMRFISHSCTPNAAFVEAQHRSNVKVLVRMVENVYAGTQITVDYGKQTWFRCACEQCWTRKDEDEDESS